MHFPRFAAEKLNPFPPFAMIATGLVLIAASLIWPKITALHGSMSASSVDFIQGFLIGIAFACEVMGIGGMVGGKSKRASSIIPRD